MIAHQRTVGGQLEIVFLPSPRRDSSFGVLRRESTMLEGASEPAIDDLDLETVVMEAIVEERAPADKGGD